MLSAGMMYTIPLQFLTALLSKNIPRDSRTSVHILSLVQLAGKTYQMTLFHPYGKLCILELVVCHLHIKQTHGNILQ